MKKNKPIILDLQHDIKYKKKKKNLLQCLSKDDGNRFQIRCTICSSSQMLSLIFNNLPPMVCDIFFCLQFFYKGN